MKIIPFFANLPDGTHCYQAALKMALFFFTGKEWSFEELDRITQKLPSKWTWPTASLLWLLGFGFEVKLMEEFSYAEFAKRGEDYLTEKFGKEVAIAQAKNSDLVREQALAAEFAKRGEVNEAIPEWSDLERLFKDNYVIICNVNSNCLNNMEGYSGHFVVITDISPTQITLHDPGLPPAPSLKVERGHFEKAWGYPTNHEKNLLALRLVL